MGKRGKRGQITLFIIVGLLILIAVLFFLFIRRQSDDVGGAFQEAITRETPIEMQPIASYIDKCLIEVSEEAVVLAGKQGGYTYPVELGVKSKYGFPTVGNAIDFPVTGMDVPLWWYLQSPDDCDSGCVFNHEIPVLRKDLGSPSIEGELEKYIDRNIQDCVRGLQLFIDKGWEIEIKEDPYSEVAIAGDDVLALLHYKFRAKNLETAEHNMESFIVRLPVPLQKIYTQALVIAFTEKKTSFLEHHSMNIINAFDYDGGDKDKLPSTGHTDFAFGDQTVWVEHEVKEQVKELLESYVPWIQVNGSSNYVPRTHPNPGVEAMIKQGMLLPNDPSLEGLEVTFNYFPDFWNQIYFGVCEEGYCAPQTAGITFPAVVGVSFYSFTYDMSYPVLVEVHDDSALGEQGYSFYFAVETNVRDNKPMFNLTPVTRLDPPNSTASELFCNPLHRTSGNVTVRTVDTMNESLPGVAITYVSGDNNCAIGLTDENGTLTARFPTAFGGIIQAQKQGYMPDTEIKSISAGLNYDLFMQLYDEVEVNFTVRGRLSFWEPGLQEWYPDGSSTYLMHDKDDIMVMLERKSTGLEEIYTTSASLMGNETGTLRLIPGDYNIQVWSIYREPIHIHDTIEYDDEEEDIDFDMNQTITGALNINITITPAMLAQDKDMVVWVAALNPVLVDDLADIELMGELETISKNYATWFIPTWV